jgi:hypothetical protein
MSTYIFLEYKDIMLVREAPEGYFDTEKGESE